MSILYIYVLHLDVAYLLSFVYSLFFTLSSVFESVFVAITNCPESFFTTVAVFTSGFHSSTPNESFPVLGSDTGSTVIV
jgi:hypothetical protein